jgi:hypothetical protein
MLGGSAQRHASFPVNARQQPASGGLSFTSDIALFICLLCQPKLKEFWGDVHSKFQRYLKQFSPYATIYCYLLGLTLLPV